MASKIDFSDALPNRVQSTLEQLRGSKWEINKENLADNALDIDIKEATVAVYRKHAQNMGSETQNYVLPCIAEIEKKLGSCKQVVHYIQSNSTELDPRVSRVNEKLIRLDTLGKVEKYTSLLKDLSDESNLLTGYEIHQTLSRLKDLRIQMLLTQYEFKVCYLSDNFLVGQYYTHNPKPLLCLKAGKEQASVEFFIEMLTTAEDDRIEYCDVEFIESLIRNAHDSASKNPDLEVGFRLLCDIFDRDQHEEICRLALEQDYCLLPPDMTFERLESSINALLAAKHKHKLSDVCALLRFNDSHLALAIDKKNIIYLFNQYGNEKSNFRPFIMAFGTARQATASLLTVLQNHPVPIKGAITLAAACDRNEFNRKAQRIALPCEDDFHPVKLETPPLTLEAICPPVFHLQNVIEVLSPCTAESYELALGLITQLNAELKFDSPINGDKQKEILDRIFFHLYHIQNKERPSAINREDQHWGSSAFQSDVLSAPEEKLRAVQRTQAEVLLSILNRIDFGNPEAQPAISLFLGALEKLQMDPKDLQGERNLAYNLFGNLYKIYIAAWEQNKEMIHPHDDQFAGNFGRNAFLDHHSIPPHFKQQVVQELTQSLKKAWDL